MSESVITLMPSLLFQSHEMVPQLFGDVSMCFITSTCSLNSLLVVCDLILLCSATQADLTTCFVYRHSSATDESRAIVPKLFIHSFLCEWNWYAEGWISRLSDLTNHMLSYDSTVALTLLLAFSYSEITNSMMIPFCNFYLFLFSGLSAQHQYTLDPVLFKGACNQI